MYQALYRKYRPKVFSDVAGQAHVTDVLRSQAASERLSHAYLFTGGRGTGKTTCAKILARVVNCRDLRDGNPCNACPACKSILEGSATDVLEMDAASNRGIDNIRALRDEWAYAPAALDKRVYIIDEVHMLTNESFNALLKTLEEPPGHILFVLATTEPHKVPATIASRCQCFSFSRLGDADITERLGFVAREENIGLTPDASELIAKAADGAMRDALSILDQCSSGGAAVDAERVRSVLGLSGKDELMALGLAIARGELGRCLELFAGVYQQGRDVSSLLDELCAMFRDMLVYSATGGRGNCVTGLGAPEISGLAGAFGGSRRILYCASRAQDAISRLGRSANQRVDAELCLAELCDMELPLSLQSLASRLERLETGAPVRIAPRVDPPPVTQEKPEPPPAVQDDAHDTPPFDPDPPPSPPIRREPEAVTGEPADVPAVADAPDDGETPSVWPDVLGRLKSEMQRSVYSHLEISRPVLSGHTLVLICESEMARALLEQSCGKIEEVCSDLGLDVKAQIRCAESAVSRLDAFINKAKGNVTIK